MHPAYEGLSAMPFYDEFDLSTVDVLLVSQYVLVRLLFIGDGMWPITGVGLSGRNGHSSDQIHVYHNQWNIICNLPVSTSVMCLSCAPTLHTSSRNPSMHANLPPVSMLTMPPPFRMSSPKPTSRAASS